jgi:tetratricopeptide (TPR) repeat protein
VGGWDIETSLRAWEAELRHRVGADFRLEAAIGVAGCLSALERHEEALAKLDEFPPRKPSPNLLAMWLNNRAYQLTMLNRASEALPCLDDAAIVVDGSTPKGQTLAGCISGTRGIALFHLGSFAEAETCLLQAFAMGEEAVAAEDRRGGPVAEQERWLAAERWYWLAEIASALGHTDEARRRYQRASEGQGRFAARARAVLKR